MGSALQVAYKFHRQDSPQASHESLSYQGGLCVKDKERYNRHSDKWLYLQVFWKVHLEETKPSCSGNKILHETTQETTEQRD